VVFASGGCRPGGGEDAGSDDGTDSQGYQVSCLQGALQSVFGTVGGFFGDPLQALGPKKLLEHALADLG